MIYINEFSKTTDFFDCNLPEGNRPKRLFQWCQYPSLPLPQIGNQYQRYKNHSPIQLMFESIIWIAMEISVVCPFTLNAARLVWCEYILPQLFFCLEHLNVLENALSVSHIVLILVSDSHACQPLVLAFHFVSFSPPLFATDFH